MRAPAFLPSLLLAPFLATACAQPAPPGPASVQPTLVVAPAQAPPAASSAVADVEAPRKLCIPEHYRKGWVSDAFSHESSAVFCLAVSEKDQSCWVALPDGLANFPPRSRPAPWPHLSSSGAHTIQSDATSVKVCLGSSETQCSTVSPRGFPGADQSEFPSEIAWHIPADVSPDGAQVMLVRHEGKRSEKVFVETYEMASAKRLGRFPIAVDQFVSRVAWIGRLALLTICVEEGPGCSAWFFDPTNGKTAAVGTRAGSINVYGIENPAHRASGESWAVVETSGSRVLFLNASTGNLEAELQTGLAADVESGVEVTRLGPDRIAIVSGAPRGGDLVVIELAGRRIASRFSAPTCP